MTKLFHSAHASMVMTQESYGEYHPRRNKIEICQFNAYKIITALIEGAGLWNTVQNYHIVDIHRQF